MKLTPHPPETSSLKLERNILTQRSQKISLTLYLRRLLWLDMSSPRHYTFDSCVARLLSLSLFMEQHMRIFWLALCLSALVLGGCEADDNDGGDVDAGSNSGGDTSSSGGDASSSSGGDTSSSGDASSSSGGDTSSSGGDTSSGATGETGRLIGFTEAHNLVRRPLGLPDLTWDDTLAAYADEWSIEQGTTLGCTIEHRPSSGPFANTSYGENLAWNKGFMENAANVVQRWSSEVAFYDYDANSCDPGEQCGHYTQVVWKDTQRVGCALYVCADGAEIWTCNYDPPGNYVGQKPY